MRPTLTDRLAAIGDRLAHIDPIMIDGTPGVVLFLSYTDGETRARTLRFAGPNAQSCWAAAETALKRAAPEGCWLRVDWVRAVEQIDWRDLRARLGRTKRN